MDMLFVEEKLVTGYVLFPCDRVPRVSITLSRIFFSLRSISLSILPLFCRFSSISRPKPIRGYPVQWSDSGASLHSISGIILSSLSRVIVRIQYHKSILFSLLKSPPIYSMLLHIIYFRISLFFYSLLSPLSKTFIKYTIPIFFILRFPSFSFIPLSSLHNRHLSIPHKLPNILPPLLINYLID